MAVGGGFFPSEQTPVHQNLFFFFCLPSFSQSVLWPCRAYFQLCTNNTCEAKRLRGVVPITGTDTRHQTSPSFGRQISPEACRMDQPTFPMETAISRTVKEHYRYHAAANQPSEILELNIATESL